jgi:hypothetical protein
MGGCWYAPYVGTPFELLLPAVPILSFLPLMLFRLNVWFSSDY